MPSDSDFMLTAVERRQKQLKRRRLISASVMLVMMIVAAIFGARPALHAIKSWQARRHAAKAFDYIEKENWNDARKEATAAYQLRPTEPEALRAVARLLSRIRQPDALEFWQQLDKVASLTREDRQDEANIAITAGETSRAEIAVNALVSSPDANPATWLLAAQVSIQKGEADNAMSALKKIFDDPRATEQQQLQAALLELAVANANLPPDERVNDAWSRVEKLSAGNSDIALQALVLLARRELSVSGQSSVVSELAQRLASHPLARAPHKLLALDVQERANPTAHNDLIAQGIAEWKNGNPDELLALATWLNGKNEFQKTLDTLGLEKAQLSRELFLQYLDALGGLARWTDIKQLLENGRYPLDPVIQSMYLARCNAQLGEKTAAENNWQRALEAAGGDPGKLVSLGEYAEKNGIFDVARSAFNAAAVEAPKLRVAQQGRLRAAQRSGNTQEIHAVLADMLKIWPNDAAVQNDEGYTRLLLLSSNQAAKDEGRRMKDEKNGATNSASSSSENTSTSHPSAVASAKEEYLNNSTGSDLDQIQKLAATLVVKNPRSMPHRTLLALAYLKDNRPADAIVVYKDITVAKSALTPSAVAVHAAVLAANGQVEDAKSEAKQIKPEQLLPEERQLIAGLNRE